MASSCRGLADDIAKCLRASPCMDEQRGQGRPFSECLKAPEADITAECARMRQLYFECKRTQLDMRKRFRGSPGY